MPIYEYECRSCGEITEKVFSVRQEIRIITCPICYTAADKIISKPQPMAPMWEPYWEENICHEPVLIKSRRHRQELMKKHGLEEKPYDKTRHRILMEEKNERKRLKRKEGLLND